MVESSAPVTRAESCSVATVRRVAAMLDLDPDEFAEGAALPRGWQFVLLGADTRKSSLRGDGFPGLGVPMPDLGLPRLLLGGRTVAYRHEIAIGATVRRTSAIKSLTRKTTDAGPMAIIVIEHALQTQADATPAIVETQTYLLLPERSRPYEEPNDAPLAPDSSELAATIVPDETLLFQYSALGFNSHKIHLDAAYAREVEGFPGLVVNGGLATLLLTELLRKQLRTTPATLKVRHVLPLFCGRPIAITAQQDGAAWRLKAFNDRGRLAVEMEVETQ